MYIILVKIEFIRGIGTGNAWELSGSVVSNRQLVFEDFADKVEQVFVISDQNVPAIPLTLAEAELLPTKPARPDIRPPFSLTFLAKDPRVLPQRLYRLEHNDLGLLEIFLVPSGKDAQGVTYCATFN